jgi:hypothetical protein
MEKIDDEYVFVKMIDDEDMNTRIVNRVCDIGDEAGRTSNIKADCTSGQLHWEYPEFTKLAEIIEEFCIESSLEMNMDNKNHRHRVSMPLWNNLYIQSQKVISMWGIRSISEEVTTPHDHWPCTWAFGYYIDPPEGCSNLVFPTLGKEIQIENGKLVIFRGHLIHEVISKEFDGDRFCIAGTVVFNPPQQ